MEAVSSSAGRHLTITAAEMTESIASGHEGPDFLGNRDLFCQSRRRASARGQPHDDKSNIAFWGRHRLGHVRFTPSSMNRPESFSAAC